MKTKIQHTSIESAGSYAAEQVLKSLIFQFFLFVRKRRKINNSKYILTILNFNFKAWDPPENLRI